MDYRSNKSFLSKYNKLINRLLWRFLLNKNAVKNITNHTKLINLFKSFKCQNLIFNRTKFIYLFSYLSNSLTTDEKLSTLFHHYNFLNNFFTSSQLSQLFKTGIECYTENIGTDNYNIILKPSGMLEFEGSLSLYFQMNGVRLGTLSFSIAPGNVFKCADESILYIACLQQHKPQNDSISVATKHFKEVQIANILLEEIDALATVFNIRKLIGVASSDQLTASNNTYVIAYQSIYDEFWKKYNGVFDGHDYVIPLPIVHKPISSIKQTHRNRAVKKREKLLEIRTKTLENLFLILNS